MEKRREGDLIKERERSRGREVKKEGNPLWNVKFSVNTINLFLH